MRNAPPDKYNVAWFKLAECVSRGEKERALGVYRLLAHSLNDPAFARQLQGDILLSFNDIPGAVEHYKISARLYQEDARLLEAAAIYEHLVTLVADKRELLINLVELYRSLRIPSKVNTHATTLCALLLGTDDLEEAAVLIAHLDGFLSAEETMQLRHQVVSALLKKGTVASHIVMPHITKIVDCLMQSQDSTALQRFLSTLEALNDHYHVQARDYMEQLSLNT